MKLLFTCAFALSLIAGAAKAENSTGFNLWSVDELHSLTSSTPNEPVPPGIKLQKLVTMSSDQDSNKTDLSLMIDSKKEVAGMYNKPDPKNKDLGDTKSKNVFWLKDIESSKGSVMLVKKGRNALIMQGALDKRTQEGRFTLKYLTNGLFMSYDSCELLLKKSGANWVVENAYTGEVVKAVKVITHDLGITTLQGLCPDEIVLE